MLRIALFLLTNIAVVVIASVTLSLLGVNHYMSENGLNFQYLLIFCFVFGMVGSLVSLLLSKTIAKWSTKTAIIKNPTNQKEAWLVDTVENLARQANIGKPDVGIFPADQANAFATGANRNHALVSISSGMLDRYPKEEVAAVLAHEISHVANGDMITLTLVQGVVNTFVMFFARVIGFAIDRVVFKHEGEGAGLGYVATVFVCEIVLGILASTIVMWFSRKREFGADEGAAYLVGAPAMVAALTHLQREIEMPNEMPKSLNAFGISSGKESGFSLASLFMSHPPLEKRIEALRNFS
ncbi:protease HtpX [Campylobacterota bacterium]|nr:protease HtpX [Campylobacterota bacterium]